MGKRIVAILLTCILCTFPLVLVSFADGYLYLDTEYPNPNIDVILVYNGTSYNGNYFWQDNQLLNSSGAILEGSLTFRVVNVSSDAREFSLTRGYGNLEYSGYHFVVPGNGYVEFTTYLNGDTSGHVIFFRSNNLFSVVDYSYSVFDASALISNVGNMFSFISGNNFLLSLLLIGVTVSLGLFSVKFIRKVMWGN